MGDVSCLHLGFCLGSLTRVKLLTNSVKAYFFVFSILCMASKIFRVIFFSSFSLISNKILAFLLFLRNPAYIFYLIKSFFFFLFRGIRKKNSFKMFQQVCVKFLILLTIFEPLFPTFYIVLLRTDKGSRLRKKKNSYSFEK